MRLSKVPLVLIDEDNLVNLKYLTNAYIEKMDGYPTKWRLYYYVNGTTVVDNQDNGPGLWIEYTTHKAAREALAALMTGADALLIEES